MTPAERVGLWLGSQRRVAAMVEQVLLSGSNFIAFLAFARFVEPEAWGKFGFAYAIVLFLLTFQSAAVIIPMITFSPRHKEWRQHRRQWAGTNLGLVLVAFLGLVASAGIARFAGVAWVEESCWMALTMCAPSLGMEFARRSAVQDRRFGLLVAMAAGYSGLLAGAVTMLRTGSLGGWAPVLAVVAATLLSTLIFTLASGRLAIVGVVRLPTNPEYAGFAGWSVMGVLAYSGYTFGVQAILGLIAGPSAVGAFHACRTLVQPVSTLNNAMDSVDKPRAATAYADHGRQGLRNVLRRWLQAVSLMALPYLGAVALWRDDLLQLVYRDTYADQGSTLLLWCVFALGTVFAQPIESTLYVIRRTRALFKLRVAASIVSMAGAVPLVIGFGAPGALAAMAAGVFITALLGAVVLRKCA